MDIANCYPTVCTTKAEAIISATAPRTATYIQRVHRTFQKQTGTTRGTPQGHPVASAIVAIAIDDILHSIRQKAFREFGALIVTYIDDIAILAHSTQTVLDLGHSVNNALHAHGMQINPEKTEYVPPHQDVVNYLGYKVYAWSHPADTLIAPKPSKAGALAKKLREANGILHQTQIISGYLNAYPSADPEATEMMVRQGMHIFTQDPTTC